MHVGQWADFQWSTYNWITIIAVFLLILPLLTGFARGLPIELEIFKYSVTSMLSSVQLIIAIVLGFFAIKYGILHNSLHFQLMDVLAKHLSETPILYAVVAPLIVIVLNLILEIVFRPLGIASVQLLSGLQRVSVDMPSIFGRAMATVLQVPRAAVNTLIFFAIVHFAVIYVHQPALQTMANESKLYQEANSKIISPLLASSLVKKLPTLGSQAQGWFADIGQKTYAGTPLATTAYTTWVHRFDSDAAINEKAKEIVAGATTDRQKAYRLYMWIGSNIQYSDYKAQKIEQNDYQNLSFGAVPTYDSHTGVCSDYSSLYVAMARAVGLQAVQVLGQAILPDGSSGPHAWNRVYLADERKWINVDPTWEQAGNFFDTPDFDQSHIAQQTAS